MWGSQPLPWGPCWGLHTGAAPVSPAQPSSLDRLLMESHPFPPWHQLHCLCLPLPVSVPDSPTFPCRGAVRWLCCAMGSLAPCWGVQGHQGAALGAASVAIAGTNPLLCPSLSNATSSCSPCSISSTHKDFILLQVSLHSQLPCPGTSALGTGRSFEAGGAIWGRDWRAAPCSGPCQRGEH